MSKYNTGILMFTLKVKAAFLLHKRTYKELFSIMLGGGRQEKLNFKSHTFKTTNLDFQ